MASTLGGNKAVSVQERIKQLIEQGVPLTEATDQAHREAVAATELMFPTTEGDRPPPGVTTAVTFGDAPTRPLSGVTTAATFGDGSTGISARPSPYFQLGEKIDVQSHSDWIKALYKNILKRDVDPTYDGHQYWMSELEKRTSKVDIENYFRDVARKESGEMQ